MPRSGTSLIASLLHKSGLNIGERLVAPGRGNPHGSFEDLDFFTFHDKALRDRGQTVFATPEFTFVPTLEELTKARSLIEERRRLPIWGWKDPRTTLFLEFWHQLLSDLCVVLVYRHPLEVLLSLVRRGDMYCVGLLEGLAAWHTYNSFIKVFYERYPDRCILVHSYSVVDQIDEFESAINHKLQVETNIDHNTFQSLYVPEDLRRLAITTDAETILDAVHPAALNMYRQIDAIADMPSLGHTVPASDDPRIVDLRNFVHSWPEARTKPGSRGALVLLFSLLEPTLMEALFTDYYSNIGDLSRGLAWSDEQRKKWQDTAEQQMHAIDQQRAWIEQLQKGKTWLEQQRGSWQQIAKQREHSLLEQAVWIEQLQQAKAGLEQQRADWEQVAKQREQALQEQAAWIEQLQQGKARLEQQRANWEQVVRQHEQALQEQAARIAELEQSHR